MDLIVAISRTLANPLRLRMLEIAAHQPGLTVGALCAELGSPQPKVSKHLSLLAKMALLDLRPAGRSVHLHPMPNAAPRGSLTNSLNALLARVWAQSRNGNSTHENVWNCLVVDELDRPTDGEKTRGRMAFWFTAYTHLRRLLILRLLASDGPATQDVLSARLSMSPAAASRQLAKLQRRRLVERVEAGGRQRWRLAAKPVVPFQAELHRLIMGALAAEPKR